MKLWKSVRIVVVVVVVDNLPRICEQLMLSWPFFRSFIQKKHYIPSFVDLFQNKKHDNTYMMINSILTRIQGPMGHWSSSPVKTCLILMFATRGYLFPCRELDFEHSNRWNAALFIQLGLNHVSVILSQRRDTLYISTIPNLKKKLRIVFCSKINLKWKFGTYTPCVARI